MSEIEDYAKAYEDLHGRPPSISQNGSWLAIGDGANWSKLKKRKSDLPAMTNQLRWMKKQRDLKGLNTAP